MTRIDRPAAPRPRFARAASVAAALLLASASLAGPSSASADALDDRVAAARTALVTRLEDVATWCDQQRVFATRDVVFRRILLLSPDHLRARAALKYRRESKTSPWVQTEYRDPVDWNKGLVPEAKKRIADASVGYRQEVMAALAAAGDLKPSRRDEVIERLVDLMPDDAELRASRGDVESGGRWLLPETIEAKARRKAIREAADRARESPGPFSARAKSIAAGWKWAWEVGDRVVLGMASAEEGNSAAAVTQAVETFCWEVLALEQGSQAPTFIYVFADPAAARTWVRKNTTNADTAAAVDHVSSTWLKDELVVFNKQADDRRVSIARQLIDRLVLVRTLGQWRGWVAEGVGQRLLWHLLGTHGSPFVSYKGTDRPTDERDDAPLPDHDLPWMGAAFEAFDRGGPLAFRALFTRNVNAFRSADVLMAYGLAAYLMEARPDHFVSFLQAAGTLEGPDEICKSVFDVDADVLFWRLRRWLSEQ